MNKAWQTNSERTATWIQFGPYQLQGIRADNVEGEELAACVQIIDSDGNTISELECEGDLELWQLRFRAVHFAEAWVKALSQSLAELRVARD